MANSFKEALSKAGVALPSTPPKVEPGPEAPLVTPSDRDEINEAPDRPGPGAARNKEASAPIPKAPEPHRGEIDISEIEPGIVVRLDPERLIASGQVTNTQDPPVTRAGLFVCVFAGIQESTWAGMTTGARRERLEIPPEWRRGGRRQWQLGEQFLTDGASLWHGDNRAFVAASWQELSFAVSRNRAYLTDEGLAAVRKEVAAQRRRRHRLRDL
jgi:hypothetical protein